MRIKGKVVDDGLRVIMEEPLPEGTEVTVLVAEDDFELSLEDQAELRDRAAEMDRGEYITADELFGRTSVKR